MAERSRTHSDDQMMRGRYPQVLEQIIIDRMNDSEKLATEVLEREETMSAFARLILQLMLQREAEPATDD